MRVWLAVVLLVCGWGAFSWWQHRPVHNAPGVLAGGIPDQEDVGQAATLSRGRFTLTTRAAFAMTGRVLSREDYQFDDLAPIAPTDLAMGWGRMSDSGVLDRIRISQSNRFYYWYTDHYPIPRREIEDSSANMHMIPANDTVARELREVRPGEVVRLQGFLVDIKRDDGWHWNTSLTREDTGAGGCEIVLVESIGAAGAGGAQVFDQ
ncbi:MULTISPECIES: hypothetical protein [unclassified Luteibacter]|uniref:hypothetical protein n=1 Tax=unclassified Luteibacter TaxID=2620188 RepID=UPI0008C36238|nr:MULTISPECIES: hypothetical protein [unclassified Luteibacter]MDR6938424.1 hypothetical protein [Luteibacter sp. 3190]SEP10656.1 hypothetical protein SAMN02800692_3714 [Luteibacter sp. UNC138MFCol5.1]